MAYQEYRVRVHSHGMEEWLNEKGQRHRLDGPAYIDGIAHAYYQNGMFHRPDGPAIINTNGDREYYQNGKLHRLDGPALIRATGVQMYYQYGKPHRLDGPALIYPNGTKEWYIDGRNMTEEEHKQMTNPTKEMTIQDIEALLGHPVKIVKGDI